ncbi:MAG TPA: helix-turn-helix domain-containing protein [Ktedonosporobacter sp.]|jgi:predicted transcriptional regulator|nr:helix-turn-helix domain-containing protein [Ktedonosporobacter sp.]
MMEIDLLQQIGFNKYEAEAYYALLSHGPLTGYEVGKYSHVPLSRSYEILERLLEKGLALVQPGEPPRYTAQEPQLVFQRIRSTMEATLNTLATSLASLAQPDRAGDFWVVRGRQHILTQVKAMIARAQTTIELVLPDDGDVAENLAQARRRGCRVFHPPMMGLSDHDAAIVLLACDGHEALVGMTSPAGACQAVTSSNRALLAVLQGYFLYRQSLALAVPEVPVNTAQFRADSWVEWEARKQRHLRSLSAEHRVA